MDSAKQTLTFQAVDRRYAELKRRHNVGMLSAAEFDEHLLELMVRDYEGRWWAKSAKTGEWHYHNGAGWVAGTPSLHRQGVPPMPSPADLLSMCARYEMHNYHVGTAIPRHKLIIAWRELSIPSTERMLALLDTGPTGNGTLGLAVCESGLYWRNPRLAQWGINDTRSRLTWREFAPVPVSYVLANPSRGHYIEIGVGNMLVFTGRQFAGESYLRTATQLLQELQALAGSSADSGSGDGRRSK